MKKIVMTIVTLITLVGCDGILNKTTNTTTVSDVNNTTSIINKTKVYDSNYTREQCIDNGFFYCDIDGQCLDLPLESGSCIG